MLKLHSIVDVITNSSTTIYTQATQETLAHVKDLLQAILYNAGIEDHVDRYFMVELAPKTDLKYCRLEYYSKLNPEYDNNHDDELYAQLEEQKPDWWSDWNVILYKRWENDYAKQIMIMPKSDVRSVNIIAEYLVETLSTIKTVEIYR